MVALPLTLTLFITLEYLLYIHNFVFHMLHVLYLLTREDKSKFDCFLLAENK